MNGIQEVSGSIPLISTSFKKKQNKNSFLIQKRVFVLGFAVAEIGWRWYKKDKPSWRVDVCVALPN